MSALRDAIGIVFAFERGDSDGVAKLLKGYDERDDLLQLVFALAWVAQQDREAGILEMFSLGGAGK
jgi:hypothetical protein